MPANDLMQEERCVVQLVLARWQIHQKTADDNTDRKPVAKKRLPKRSSCTHAQFWPWHSHGKATLLPTPHVLVMPNIASLY